MPANSARTRRHRPGDPQATSGSRCTTRAAVTARKANAIGGFVFEWRDEWWKYLQEENLDTQDNNASWSNQAYLFDWAEGKNNMNEEWFGIMALGTGQLRGCLHGTSQDGLVDVLSKKSGHSTRT